MVMAGRPTSVRALDVWFNDQRVGRWSVHARTGHSFHYDDAWLRSPLARPLSWRLPLAGGPRRHGGAAVSQFFEQLLPATPAQRLKLQLRTGTVDASAFELLRVLGRDCVGAVSLLPPDQSPGDMRQVEAEALDAKALGALLNDCLSPPDAPPRAAEWPRSVLPGRRPKLALLWHGGRWCLPRGATPTTHVLKLGLGALPVAEAPAGTSLDNEWLCARLLAAYGFEVAPVRLETVAGHRVLISERFDRRWIDRCWWARLPAYSFQQAAAPARRADVAAPMTLARMLELLRAAERPAQDRERLFMAIVLGWMLGATDRTATQFSVLVKAGGSVSLAPLQGFLSAWPILGRTPKADSIGRLHLALPPVESIGPTRHDAMTRQQWLDAARRLSLGEGIAAVLDGLAAWTPQAIERVTGELPKGFPASVAESVFAGLRRCAVVLAH
jgi:serine/threonine-protein kinase HipA